MPINESFITALQKWLLLEHNITNINNKLKQIKEEKNAIETKLLAYIEQNNLKTTNFSLNNNSIIYNINNTPPSLSLKLLTEVLDETISDNNLKLRIINNLNIKKQKLSKPHITLKRKPIKIPKSK